MVERSLHAMQRCNLELNNKARKISFLKFLLYFFEFADKFLLFVIFYLRFGSSRLLMGNSTKRA